MSVTEAYLARLREQFPIPRWLEAGNPVGPDRLPTPFTLDAEIRDGALYEWRIVFDPLSRSDGGDATQPRSSRIGAKLDHMSTEGLLGAIAKRVQDLTVGADRAEFLAAKDERLLLSPPWSDGVKQNIDSVRVADLVMAGAPSLLTGPLGSGKSTYCRWFANAQATRRIHDPSAPLPIFVDLRMVARQIAPMAADDGVLSMDELCRAVLVSLALPPEGSTELAGEWTAGRAQLLVDGLDEIGVVLSRKAAGPVEAAFVRTLNSLALVNSNVLVSSRPGVRVIDELGGFLEVEFAPLTVAESTELLSASRSLSAATPDRVAALVSAIPEQLRTRPLFLSLVGRLVSDDSLPEDLTRWTLLDASLRELLSVRPVDKGHVASVDEVFGCSYESVVSALQQVAYEAHVASEQEGRALSIDPGRLMRLLYERDEDTQVTRVLEVVTREAGLMIRTDDRLEYVHRVFQDLLTAGYLSGQAMGDRDHQSLLAALARAPHVLRDAAELYVDCLSSELRVNDLLDMCNAALEAAGAVEGTPLGGTYVWLAAIGLREVVKAGYRLSRRDEVVVDGFLESAVKYVGDTEALGLGDRALIAEQASEWGDRRPGVGIDRGDLPDHAWVEVPGGEYVVGLDEPRHQALLAAGISNLHRELDAKPVSLSGFTISLYPTTWTQFRAFLTAQDGYVNAQWWNGWNRAGADLGTPKRLADLISSTACGNTPVVGVDWFEAIAYCRWLGSSLGQEVDLPTEEEWEVASRGPDGLLYPWGDAFDGAAVNWAGSGLGRVIPVGCFGAARGRDGHCPLDMIGNVWEWTRSIAGPAGTDGFSQIGSADAGDASGEVRRVVRGGCYLNEFPLLRSTYRGNDVATARFDRQGFRVVRR